RRSGGAFSCLKSAQPAQTDHGSPQVPLVVTITSPGAGISQHSSTSLRFTGEFTGHETNKEQDSHCRRRAEARPASDAHVRAVANAFERANARAWRCRR